MNDVSVMKMWLQSCLDASETGTVNAEYSDGIPGNCSLYYLGTEELGRSTDVEGNILARYRCHFQLRRVSIGSESGAIWLAALTQMFMDEHGKGYEPGFSDLPGQKVYIGAVKQLRCDPDGVAEYAAELYGEYDAYFPGEEIT